MSAGRKPLKHSETIDAEATLDKSAFANAMTEMHENGKVAQAVIDFEDPLRQLGQLDALDFMRRVADVGVATIFESLRKSGKYKGLPYKDTAGNLRYVADIKELCDVKLGKSYRRCMDLSQNLRLLGPELYEQSERLGLRNLDYKAIRALPEDDQLLIKRAIEETKSRDDVLNILQELAAKHAREKEAATAEIDSLKGDIAAKEERLSRRAKQIDELEGEVERVKLLPPDKALDELHQEATSMLNDTRGALIGKFSACVKAIDAHHAEHGSDSAVFLAGLVGQLQADLTALRDRFSIPDIAPAMIPEWVTDPAFDELSSTEATAPKH